MIKIVKKIAKEKKYNDSKAIGLKQLEEITEDLLSNVNQKKYIPRMAYKALLDNDYITRFDGNSKKYNGELLKRFPEGYIILTETTKEILDGDKDVMKNEFHSIHPPHDPPMTKWGNFWHHNKDCIIAGIVSGLIVAFFAWLFLV